MSSNTSTNWNIPTAEVAGCDDFLAALLEHNLVVVLDQVVAWTADETNVLERYFSLKVVCPPFKQNNLLSYCRMTSAPPKLVKDFIRIITKQLVGSSDVPIDVIVLVSN